MLTTIPPTLLSPGRRQTQAPGSPQHTLAASLPRRPVSGRLCAAAGATRSPPASPSAPALRSGRGPAAPPPRGGAPAALRSPGRPLPAAARERLRPHPRGQRGARSFQQPAGQSPSPPCAGRGHFPRRQGDTGATRLQASRRCAAPRGRREPRSPLRQPLWAGGPAAARSGYGRARPWGGQGGRRSAVATERLATTKGSGWWAARVEGVDGG